MEVASVPAGMDAYEDMFKEITRKLYGDESVATDYEYAAYNAMGVAVPGGGGPPINGLAPPPQPPHADNDPWFTSHESLEWTSSKIASFNPVQRLYRCVDCECCGFVARVAEHWLGTHANLQVFQCPQCDYSSPWARCMRMHMARQHNAPEHSAALWKESPVLGEVTKYLNRLRARVEADDPGAQGRPATARSGASPPGTPRTGTSPTGTGSSPTAGAPTAATPPEPRDPAATDAPAPGKRYSCSFCPYTTDRRDLYTRHEAIHREEKPFHCYVCQKQFNRADHVKKHFLRMHRDHPYDLNRIRRSVSAADKTMAFYAKYDHANNQGDTPDGVNAGMHIPHAGMHMAVPSTQLHLQQHGNHLNIPTANFPSVNNRLQLSASNGQVVKPSGHVGSHAGGLAAMLDAPKMAGAGAGSDKPEASEADAGRTKNGKEKRYSCCYCNWSGVDNWCLKRHLNTHLKPFVCTLCDYKAARSERLATHVLKVHNKRTCGRCSFMADDVAQMTIHQQQHHGQLPAPAPEPAPNTARGPRRALKRGAWGAGTGGDGLYHGGTGIDAGAYPQANMHQPIMQQGHMQQQMAAPGQRRVVWRKKTNGADRLFSYMEASDSEDDESMMGGGQDCPHCGCHFVDDLALQTHMVTHHRMGQAPGRPYRCSMCGYNSASQADIVTHMQRHTAVELRCPIPSCRYVTTVHEAMEEHARLAHPPLPPLEQKCPHCGFVVLSGVALSRHAKGHHVANADCASCSRVHARFERHRNGETWPLSDDEERAEVPSETEAARKAARKAAAHQMRLQRARSYAYKKRLWRARAVRSAARGLLATKRVKASRSRSRSRSRSQSRSRSGSRDFVHRLRRKYRRALLFRRRYSCYTCHMTRRSLVSIHSPGSLALHRLWRHAHERYPCDSCELRFPRRYQVLLHATREHARCPSAASINAAIAEPIVTLTVPQVAVPLAPAETAPQHVATQLPQQQACMQKVQEMPQPMHQPQQHQMQQPQQHMQAQQFGHAHLQHHMAMPNGGYHPTVPQDAYPYSQAAAAAPLPPPPPPAPQQQQQHFQPPMYNMVPKQMWYPQLPAPSYYIPAPFPPS